MIISQKNTSDIYRIWELAKKTHLNDISAICQRGAAYEKRNRDRQKRIL